MSSIILDNFINYADLFKHEEEVCNDVGCSNCPFTDGVFCKWKIFFDNLPKYRVDMRGSEE